MLDIASLRACSKQMKGAHRYLKKEKSGTIPLIKVLENQNQMLYQTICASFCVTIVLCNILSAKMTLLPILGFPIPAGLIFYPLTFLLSDLVTEIFGSKKAKLMVYIAFAASLLGFGMIQLSLLLPSATLDDHSAFQAVLGLSGLRIFSSLISYLISQLVGIQLYAAIRLWTGPTFLWLRNNVSACLSQIIDTVIIDLLFLCWGLNMSIADVIPIMLFSYFYKAFASVVCTPLFYLFVFLIRGKKSLVSKSATAAQLEYVGF